MSGPGFDWKQYIEIDKSVTADKRAIIEDMLDLEFRDRNKNGLPDDKIMGEIIRQIRTGSKKKLLIRSDDTDPNGTCSYSNYPNDRKVINLSFSEAKISSYISDKDGTMDRSWLNGSFRHESQHIADVVKGDENLRRKGFDPKKLSETIALTEKECAELSSILKYSNEENGAIKKALDLLISARDQGYKLIKESYPARYVLEKNAVEAENTFNSGHLNKGHHFTRSTYALGFRDFSHVLSQVQYAGLKGSHVDHTPRELVTDKAMNFIVNIPKYLQDLTDDNNKKWHREVRDAQQRFIDLGIISHEKAQPAGRATVMANGEDAIVDIEIGFNLGHKIDMNNINLPKAQGKKLERK